MVNVPSAKTVTQVTVLGSVTAAVVVAMVIATPRTLPGAALGSVLILRVEWAVALFAALLLAIVVLARAWEGRLPSEISGRGVKYADAARRRPRSMSRRRRWVSFAARSRRSSGRSSSCRPPSRTRLER